MSDANTIRNRPTWQDRLPWLLLLRAFRPAVSVRMLLCALAGLLLMIAGWRVCWRMFGESNDPLIREVARYAADGPVKVWPAWPWETRWQPGASLTNSGAVGIIPHLGPTDPASTAQPPSVTTHVSADRPNLGIVGTHISKVGWTIWQITLPFQFLFRQDIGWTGLAFSLLCGLWSLAVWAFVGGAMTRIMALQLTRDETIPWRQASDFALKHWVDYFTAPLYPLLGVLLATLPVFVLGLFARPDISSYARAILWPLAMVGGLWLALGVLWLALRQSGKSELWRGYMTAIFYLLSALLLAVSPLLIMSFLSWLGIGAYVTAIFWPLALLAGLFMAVLMLILFFAWPLMWGTVSVEGNDAFDGLSRAYAYTYERPLRYLFYGLVATVLGVLGYLLVSFFAHAIVHLTIGAASWGAGSARFADPNAIVPPGEVRVESLLDLPKSYPAVIIVLCNALVGLLPTAFTISYLWSATVVIYLLLRRDVDATQLDQVQLDQEERFGLPPLTTDAHGVPGEADSPGNA